MAIYALSHIDVDGVQHPGPEVTLLMDCGRVITAVYEAMSMSVRIKAKDADKTVTKITVTVETIIIPAGETVNIPYDPATDVIEI